MSEIYGDVFLVPAVYSVEENENISNYYMENEVAVRGEKISPKSNEAFVQIWCTSPGHSDWQNHTTPGLESSECWGNFPEYIPLESLSGLREGDAFTIAFRGRVYRLTCRQYTNRYYRLGSFQNAIKYLERRFQEREYY